MFWKSRALTLQSPIVRCLSLTALLSITSSWAGPQSQSKVDVSPLPTRLPSSAKQYVRFHFLSRPPSEGQPAETVTAAFQWNGSQADAVSQSCRVQLSNDSAIALADEKGVFPPRPSRAAAVRRQSNSYCSIGSGATIVTRADGLMDATVPIAFTKPGRYRLYVRTASTGWSNAGEYRMDADITLNLGIQLVGVTPTQAVVAINPPVDTSVSCQIQVTAARNGSDWDFSTLAPDTDPSIFPGADNADLNDPDNAPQNRGFALPDGTRGLVIGKRVAEYSPYTFKMHSRALQAATFHAAWVSCGSVSSWIEFTTANIMPGISYSDPLPADPDRPGDYAYPTLSWTNRSEGAVDPQTGIMIRPISLVTDGILNFDFTEWKGNFSSTVAGYPYRSLPAKSVFLPASIPKALPSWFALVVDQSHPAWRAFDSSLMSFLPTTLAINCPLCADTPITICLTGDGISCAVDRNVSADPSAVPDPNTNQKGILGTTINCTGNCNWPGSDSRWQDSTPILAAWHPNYAAGARTVLPNFQFDSVKPRVTPVSCTSSALVFRATDAYGNPQGAPFNPSWSRGTPLFIDSVRYTVNQLYDENSLLLNESCPSNAQTMTADTFGLLVSSAVPLNSVVAGQWKAKIHKGLTSWDAASNLTTFTNCSHQPVLVNGQKGWHCTIGYGAYFIAADGSFALPMGATGIPYRDDIATSIYCAAAFWDDLDANSLYCLTGAPNTPGKRLLAQMTFFGDHQGLETARFTNPELGGVNSYLPACKSTNPPSPNNCWKITVMKTTGTNTTFIVEDAIRDGAPDAWKNSAFAAAIVDGVSSSINSKLDESHLMLTTALSQNSYGFSAILEYSTPRGSVKLRSVMPSWTAAPNSPPGSKPLRWSGLHSPGGDAWGATRVGIGPTYFRGCCGAGQGPYYSKIISTAPAVCPAGASGTCIAVKVDGQPGVQNPSKYEPVNDNKTRKPGFGYLTDLAVGDVLCAPNNNDYSGQCTNWVFFNTYEHLRVADTATADDGTLVLTLQRNLGNTVTTPLAANQQMFAMPNICDYFIQAGCSVTSVVWDWSNGSVERVNTGGDAHQFTSFDPVTRQVANVTAGSFLYQDPLCYGSVPSGYLGCYSMFGGKLDPAKPINSQLPSFFQGLITLNPPFGVGSATPGLTGTGSPNSVDSHPGAHQLAVAPNEEKIWFVDGHPFNGSGNGSAAPVETAPNVYRFAAPSDARASSLEVYKRLPMMASCGINVLKEVTQISNQKPYSYCVAVNAGDCSKGSLPGDSYVTCPVVKPSAKPNDPCPYAGIGQYTPEVRDTCLTTVGPFTMGLTQTGFVSQVNGVWSILPADRRLRSGRMLTHGFARYRVIDQFWNPKTTPDGGVLLFRATFLAQYTTQFLMARIPPFPDVTKDPLDRRGFIPTPAIIDPGPEGAASVKVQFGYDPAFRCISRPEACEARGDFDSSGRSTPFYFASESAPDGISCVGSCPSGITLPGISQRVMFYRAVYQINGSSVFGPTRVTVVPDPVPVTGN